MLQLLGLFLTIMFWYSIGEMIYSVIIGICSNDPSYKEHYVYVKKPINPVIKWAALIVVIGIPIVVSAILFIRYLLA